MIIKIKPAVIIYARGKAWKEKNGLASIGWDRIGRIYNYCYVYKAKFDKILKVQEFNNGDYSETTIDRDIYIIVTTSVQAGVRYGIYSKYRDTESLIDLSTAIQNYITITDPNDPFYIGHNSDMDIFIDSIR